MRDTACRPSCSNEPPCRPKSRNGLATFAAVVDDYIRRWRPHVDRDRAIFQSRSLREAIKYAALAKLPDEKRHPHQYRLKSEVLAEAERRLQACSARLRRCSSFTELHELVKREIGGIRGIGPLTIYDVANGIGAQLKRQPERVYLHAGTSAGARALGLDHRRQSLDPSELPSEFQRLQPWEIEDCLCLYKDALQAIRSKRALRMVRLK